MEKPRSFRCAAVDFPITLLFVACEVLVDGAINFIEELIFGELPEALFILVLFLSIDATLTILVLFLGIVAALTILVLFLSIDATLTILRL